eukprot:SAG11_NODE_430_length_9532_cov_13.089685_4_plen_71_part_00
MSLIVVSLSRQPTRNVPFLKSRGVHRVTATVSSEFAKASDHHIYDDYALREVGFGGGLWVLIDSRQSFHD